MIRKLHIEESIGVWKETPYSLFINNEKVNFVKYTKEYSDYKIMILPDYNRKTDTLGYVVILFIDGEEPRKLEVFETSYDAKDFADYEVYDMYIKSINESNKIENKINKIRKLGVNESLQPSEIDMFPRIGILYGKVFVSFYNPNTHKLEKGDVYILDKTYLNINNILYDLSKMNNDIPDNITHYETLFYEKNNTSTICIESYNEDIKKYVQIQLTLYSVAHFLSPQEIKRLGISLYGANK